MAPAGRTNKNIGRPSMNTISPDIDELVFSVSSANHTKVNRSAVAINWKETALNHKNANGLPSERTVIGGALRTVVTREG